MKNRDQREPRNDLSKKVNLLRPITIEDLGGEDDPCFAKLYDITTPECQRCGDCEVCAVAMSQKNHILRNKEHKNGAFKDLEEVKEVDKKVIRKKIRERIMELVKAAGKKGIPYQKVLDDVKGSYAKFGISIKKFRSIIDRVIQKRKLIHKENIISWKQK